MGRVRHLVVCCNCSAHDVWLAEGMYANFAGRDASRGMAKQSFDLGMCMSSEPMLCIHSVLTKTAPDMLTPVDQPLDKLDDLTPEEMCVRTTSRFVTYSDRPHHAATTCEVRRLALIISPPLTRRRLDGPLREQVHHLR